MQRAVWKTVATELKIAEQQGAWPETPNAHTPQKFLICKNSRYYLYEFNSYNISSDIFLFLEDFFVFKGLTLK